MALEILAVAMFWAVYRTRPLLAVIVFCVLAYAAWSFKQSNVVAVGAVGLFLLYRHQWRQLSLLVTVMVAGWAAALLVGSDIYRTSILLSEYESINTAANALRIFLSIIPKTLPAVESTRLSILTI